MNSITDMPNSFITYNETVYLTQRECAIVRPFCLPVFNASDIAFQFTLNSTSDLATVNSRLRVRTKNINGTFTFVTGFYKDVVELAADTYLVVIVLQNSTLLTPYTSGDCFQIDVGLSFEGEIYYNATSIQCFQVISDTCYTSKLEYYNNENAFGFIYFIAESNYENRIRLPIYFRNPQVKNDQDTYVKSNGERKKLYAILSKQFQGLVDNTTEEVHQKLIVALSHDNVTFVTDNDYQLECTFENEYNNNFPEVLMGVNVWNADFLVMETPFSEQNNNCI